MGELENQVFVIGSPDIDVMFSNNLPSLQQVKDYYKISFDNYSVVLFHPVTTEQFRLQQDSEVFVSSMLEDTGNYVVIYPNNDMGTSTILTAYEALKGNPRFKIFPSLRFEYFLRLLKNSDFMIGNSSAGIREAPYYGIPSINLGSRQKNRAFGETIIHADFDKTSIKESIAIARNMGKCDPKFDFGNGNSSEQFFKIISSPEFWESAHQKQFNDLN